MHNLKGFTLVELLAAVAIIGVLATLALPRYRAFVARGRFADPKINLANILSLERSYFYEYNKEAPSVSYGPCKGHCTSTTKKNELGFRTADCSSLRYVYSGVGGATGASADSDGCEVYPNCSENDQWSISSAGTLSHGKNVIEHCAN